jgi:NADH-quinone oxidoreductase subunit L
VGHYGFWCGLIAAFLTAFYSWRLMIMTFHGKPRADKHRMEHVHESPLSMTGPLLLLACGAVLTGYVFHEQLLGADWQAFWGDAIMIAPTNHILHDMEEVSSLVALAPTVLGVLGIATAYLFYMFRPGIPVALAARFGGVYRFLLNKWYFDELYDAIFVKPIGRLSRLLWRVDGEVIDGLPNGVASLTAAGSGQIVRLQTGSIAQYAFVMLIGVVALVSVFLIFG